MGIGSRQLSNGGIGAGRFAAALVAVSVCAMPSLASAQQLLDQYLTQDLPGVGLDPGVTVRSRLRPEYDAPGIRYGEITIRPELSETIGLDDNVLALPTHKASALIETNARVSATYDHSDTSGFANLSVDNNRYPEQNQQSYTNWTAAIGGSHQFGRDTLSVAYEHLNLNETVRDLDVPNLDNALPYQVDTLRLGYRAYFSRLFVEPNVAVSNYSLTNGSVAGIPYIQTDQDRVVVEPGLTFGYELAPRRNVVLVLHDAVASYRNRMAAEASRDFNDISALTGLDFEEGIFRYRLLVGYEARTFSNTQYKTIADPIAEALVIWNPTGLTTLTGSVYRHIQNSADETTTAFTETAVGLRLDHELQPNVLLGANGQYLRDDYSAGQTNQSTQASGQGGRQERINRGAGATWLINRNLRMMGSYEFDRRNTTGGIELGVVNGQRIGSGYSEDRVLLTFRFAL